MRKFGLIGKNIDYSFSQSYFTAKFKAEEITDANYQNFDLESITDFPSLLEDSNIKGFNITIPYKELIIPYVDKLDKNAKKIGAINTIKFTKKGKLKGYNTDYYGFKNSLLPHLKPHHTSALILGTGGASKAIAYALKKLNISYTYVSRNATKENQISYQQLTETILKKNTIIVNCTPLGTYPDIKACPNIPYQAITEKHLLFDLIYNPEESTFLKYGKQKKATIINGYKMLQLQAEKSWQIWNK
ncbi:shikimate dehydrogenase [Oceanihabitans sp. 2_MG-2023]|uniref:shikimate dehydrogenase family protein n=1 Tax=Oceanihabitans sp. 2_MG-2023 TaxID=3062661 RepID=UPI0026E2F71F|nr:shikimate dehydrogenase [Oceanihabitans sp. 2_MG-2023]MDO6598090.1 shikimate dehydrogenase [Oceanihabitans sp. 2_MG-2023]